MLLAAAVVTVLVSGHPDGLPQAQVCPVGPNLAWTAAHIVEQLPTMYWRLGAHNGRLEVLTLDSKRDLARVRTVDSSFPIHYRVGPLPESGSMVSLFGMRLYTDGVYRLIGFFVALDNDGDGLVSNAPSHPGTSGSCILDGQGRAVMVNLGTTTYHINGEKTVMVRGRPIPDAPKE